MSHNYRGNLEYPKSADAKVMAPDAYKAVTRAAAEATVPSERDSDIVVNAIIYGGLAVGLFATVATGLFLINRFWAEPALMDQAPNPLDGPVAPDRRESGHAQHPETRLSATRAGTYPTPPVPTPTVTARVPVDHGALVFAIRTNPGSDHYAQEFREVGRRADELASLYADLLLLIDPELKRFPSLPALESFQSWDQLASEARRVEANCLLYRISNLQAAQGALPLDQWPHPLHATLRAADAMMRPTPALARTTPGR